MPRNRVLSFMSAFGAPKSPQSTTFSGPQEKGSQLKQEQQDVTHTSSPQHTAAPSRDSPPPRTRTERASSRPMSMVQTYQPPLMEVGQDTVPELQPIFTFLNSHANKLYQEGYFLKLNDLDTRKIETLPTRSSDVQPLQNVLSISTAGKNRYLFHFNSLHSLTQWTAAIRLAMYENATLQEAYTGSLIAGKGKLLNNIKVIMEKTKFKNEDWTRVRFGAGTPWRRCWCVISPPDEKEVSKQQKRLKKSAYERSQPLKGTIKFYDTKKTKKATPIATINEAYSAYAIYPQSKPLIDQSTLIKVEGIITIHSTPDITTEGFIFVMPEVHPAVSGFEMMLRFLFPTYDIFALYGRPNRLIADTLDPRSLMFALPQERRYGYLEILDVASLIHEKGSQAWAEKEWRKKMKDLTSARMTRMTTNGRPRSRASSYRDYRNSLPPSRGIAIRYEDGASIKSTPSLRDDVPPMPPPHTNSAPPNGEPFEPPQPLTPRRPQPQHQRSFSQEYPASEPRYRRSQRQRDDQSYTPSRLSYEQSRPSYEGQRSGRPSYEQAPPMPSRAHEQPPPAPPAHGVPLGIAAQKAQMQQRYEQELEGTNDRSSSESSDRRYGIPGTNSSRDLNQDLQPSAPPTQVAPPPAFSHEPGAKPQKRPGISPDLRRANSRLSVTTLQQLAEAGKNSTVGGTAAAAGAAAAWRSNSGSQKSVKLSEDQGQRGVNHHTASKPGYTADRSPSAQGMVPVNPGYISSSTTASRSASASSSQVDVLSPPYYKDKPLMNSYDLLTPVDSLSRQPSPLSQSVIPSPPPRDSSIQKTLNSQNTYQTQPNTLQKLPPIPADTQRPSTARSTSSYSIKRKPVPSTRTSSASRSPPKQRSPTRDGAEPEPPLPGSRPSLDSLHDRYIDEDALAQVLAQQHLGSLNSESQVGRQDDESSIYDNASTVSPDYASTRKSTETKRSQRSVERPRRGVLKTVGTAEPEAPIPVQIGDAQYRPGTSSESQVTSVIPTVDFGPTQLYKPDVDSRPDTSGTLTQPSHERSKSQDRLTLTPSPIIESSGNEQSSNEYYPGPNTRTHEKPPTRNLVTPEPQLRGPSPTNDNRRSMVWQPGAQIGGSPGSRTSITPEQFVQQRAAAGRITTPVYAHGRQTSASPTPPIASRQSSGEVQNQTKARNKLQKRQSSYGPEMAPRPHSRAASNLINAAAEPTRLQKRQSSYGNDIPSRPHSRTASNLMTGSGDYPTHLSAREQEHVARLTGSPLINMAGGKGQDSNSQGGGLIGAIEAREKEKKDIKEGLSGQAVQQAIAQRQYYPPQQRQMSYGTPSPQFATPQPHYAMPGGYPPSPGTYPPYANQQQQYGWTTPPQQQQPQPQQQYQQYQQQPQFYQQQQWTPPSAGQLVGTPQRSPYPQQQAPQQFYPNGNQHNQYQQGHYGYFGSGSGR
ncbi:uncharacterized protein KY384_008498 [Bacidia gigantensis]|uniref:uncharacterized protein n=1 Tax=Bacidia gigantensis TaxID=2732470 RepID=UPI001D054B1E|nr:uncharacterized protein KY384_008498 [Bacidia gigantensis]KAG8527069.1 hypothetical protein KY384_008498 [Bacidia gigantensis]